MVQRIIFHIGSPKTGTSIIQRALASNKGLLSESGYFYEPYDSYDHCKIITSLVNDFKSEGDSTSLVGFLNKYYAEANSNNSHTLIISSECLLERDQWLTNAISGWTAEKNLDVQVICYLRNLGDYMISAWQQWYYKSDDYDNFDDFVNYFSTPLSWSQKLKNWSFSDNCELKLKRYARESMLNNDVISDFIHASYLGSEFDYLVPMENPTDSWNSNRSFNLKGVKILELLKAEAHGNMHDHHLQLVLDQKLRSVVYGGENHRLTATQAKRLNQRFGKLYRAIDQYDPDLSQHLVAKPSVEENHEIDYKLLLCEVLDVVIQSK